MNETELLAQRFEDSRPRLRNVAYRMLGSLAEADDAVQEAWLHASRSGADGVSNVDGWITTIVARVCLDMLRSRKSRREELVDTDLPGPGAGTGAAGAGSGPAGAGWRAGPGGPEEEAVMADSVGLAMLVVLDTLSPAERVAFVLHDMFDVPFEEIASATGRTSDAARQLASRARRRVRGAEPRSDHDRGRKRRVVEAFLRAARGGDLGALVELLDPDVVLRTDEFSRAPGLPLVIRGAATVAGNAASFRRAAAFAQIALVDGEPALVLAPRGHLNRVMTFQITDGKVTTMDVIADPARLARLEITIP
jgi:RNA polymerase sigma factor (sigma-70 family)